MRVCIVVDNFFGVGGTETNTRTLVQLLQKAGHEVSVVTSWKRKSQTEFKIFGARHRSNEPVYELKKRLFFETLVSFFIKIFLLSASTLITAANEEVELIHAHMALPAGFAAVVAGVLLRKPVIISVRGSDLNVFAHKPVARDMVKFSLGKAKATIALSQGLKKAALDLGVPESRILVIPNGIDTTFFGMKDAESCRAQLGVKDNEKIVLFVGTIESYRREIKGFDYLISAMKIVTSQVPSVRLMAVGVPPLPELVNLVSRLGIRDNVSFAGVVPYDNIPVYYGASNVFVLPSLMEGLPTAILEAMASAKPIVASNIEGCRDLIVDGVNGFLVGHGQVDALAERILLLVTNDELAERMGKEARKIAKLYYSWDSVLQKILGIYKAVRQGTLSQLRNKTVFHDS
jgi:glycosyltransferase involved in cell wall biosynthesis